MDQRELLSKIDEHTPLCELQEYVRRVVLQRGFSSQPIQETMLLFLEEAGELAKAIRNTATGLSVDVDKLQNYGTVESEAADVFFVLLAVCNQLGVDLLRALKEKEEENCKRNWSFEK